MFCKYCGTSLSDGAMFCKNCGKLLAEPKSSEATQSMAGINNAAGATANAAIGNLGSSNVFGNVATGIPVDAGGAGGLYMQPGMTSAPPVKKFPIKAIVIVATIVLVAVICLIAFFSGRSGPASSAEAICSRAESAVEMVFDDPSDTDNLVKAVKGVLELMPEELQDEVLDELGISSLSDMSSRNISGVSLAELEGALGSMSEYMEYLSGFDISIGCTCGDAVSKSKLDDINSDMQSLGSDRKATDAKSIDCEITVTATGDNAAGMAIGESESDTTSTMFYTVEIDGKWYLWCDV